jgi:hypothetical protein
MEKMNTKKSLAIALALSFGLLGRTAAQAEVITFDDLPQIEFADVISNGYQGFDWSWFGYIHQAALPNTGFEQGVVSGQYAAYNDFAATATTSGSLFDFNGAFLTGAWNDGLNIEVTGSTNGLASYSKTVVVNSTQAQWFDFNFLGIDSLSFRSYGGERNPLLDGEGEHFIVDNFTYNEPVNSAQVSEPPALMLFGMGIFFLGLLNNLRRKI